MHSRGWLTRCCPTSRRRRFAVRWSATQAYLEGGQLERVLFVRGVEGVQKLHHAFSDASLGDPDRFAGDGARRLGRFEHLVGARVVVRLVRWRRAPLGDRTLGQRRRWDVVPPFVCWVGRGVRYAVFRAVRAQCRDSR